MESLTVPTGVLRRFSLSYPTALVIVLLVTLLTRLPTSFGHFSSDDFLIRAMTGGDAVLYQHGFTKADPHKSLGASLLDGFHFFSPKDGTLQFYRSYGNLPWWTADKATMDPLRPVSAFTHWVDAKVAPNSVHWQTFHTLIYVLLFAWMGLRLYWRLSLQPSVAVLAALMLAVDLSQLLNYNWVAARNVFIAGALGCAMLERFLVWREEGSRTALVASLSMFVAGLLAAESSIALMGYVIAYLVLAETGSWRDRALAVLPYVLVLVVWRVLYNLGGFGASGIGLYVDPGHAPLHFLATALQGIPTILASTIITVDGMLMSLAPRARPWLALAGAILVFGCTLLVWGLVRRSPRVRFMFAGSVLAAVPGAALITEGSRSGLFVGLGFFWVVSVWLHDMVQNSPRRFVSRLVLGIVLALNLVFPALAGFGYTSRLVPVHVVQNQQYDSVAKPLQAADGNKALVVVNYHTPNMAFYLPFEWRFDHGLLPTSLNLLAPGFVSFDLTRVSDRTFELVAPEGLPLDHTKPLRSKDGKRPIFSSTYAAQMAQDLFASPQTHMYPGFQRRAGEMRVTVEAMMGNEPSRLRIDFVGKDDPDNMLWERFDWTTREYHALPVPAIGKTLHFTGPFDTHADKLVKLCVNC